MLEIFVNEMCQYKEGLTQVVGELIYGLLYLWPLGITTVLFLSITYVLYMILWPLLKKELPLFYFCLLRTYIHDSMPLLKMELPLFYFCLLRTYIHDSMATIEEGITTVLAVILTITLHAYPPLLRRLQLEKSLTEREAQVELQATEVTSSEERMRHLQTQLQQTEVQMTL